ncbi:WD domain [Striga asiatica]|uniref:WD domain n=1 Tax=Striga asiatica TaxID=4170 RepID=A0A5A7R192_STRAF|nr:WD domain [Striga asiatica]
MGTKPEEVVHSRSSLGKSTSSHSIGVFAESLDEQPYGGIVSAEPGEYEFSAIPKRWHSIRLFPRKPSPCARKTRSQGKVPCPLLRQPESAYPLSHAIRTKASPPITGSGSKPIPFAPQPQCHKELSCDPLLPLIPLLSAPPLDNGWFNSVEVRHLVNSPAPAGVLPADTLIREMELGICFETSSLRATNCHYSEAYRDPVPRKALFPGQDSPVG